MPALRRRTARRRGGIVKRQMAIEGKAELALVDAEVVTGGRRRLGPVSLAFGAGALHGIIGHNGSGKSTLLKLLARQAVPTSGAVTLAGEAVARLAPRAFARRIAYLAELRGGDRQAFNLAELEYAAFVGAMHIRPDDAAARLRILRRASQARS